MHSWIINGAPADRLPADDRGLAYGDGLFETLLVRNARACFLDAHLARLAHGCERLAIPRPDAGEIKTQIENLIAQHDCDSGSLKIIVTRGSGPRGYGYDPESVSPATLIGINPGALPVPQPEGVRVRYCDTRVSRNPALGGIKTLNRLPQVLARAEWRDPEISEGLMEDDRANLIAGTMTNLFIVTNNQLITPPVTDCGIAGVMRAQVIKWVPQLSCDSKESYFGRTELEQADEVFLTNSLIGIWPVRQVGDAEFTIGKVSRALLGLWQDGANA